VSAVTSGTSRPLTRLTLRREALTELTSGELSGLAGAGPALPTFPIDTCLVYLSRQACTINCPSDGTTSCAC
jgi:hypothetical protein